MCPPCHGSEAVLIRGWPGPVFSLPPCRPRNYPNPVFSIHEKPPGLSENAFKVKVNAFVDMYLGAAAAKEFILSAHLIFSTNEVDSLAPRMGVQPSSLLACVIYELESKAHVEQIPGDPSFRPVFQADDQLELHPNRHCFRC
ncbi:unnamed protein product [Mycena citricolor]|uniref:Uncharacterized protein n=1 Tax=Mycena citricolor TaxID=2018698 RepID=A0AAD2HCB0_9AGAR|nr:unnamed protein product [Mycena citricolor]